MALDTPGSLKSILFYFSPSFFPLSFFPSQTSLFSVIFVALNLSSARATGKILGYIYIYTFIRFEKSFLISSQILYPAGLLYGRGLGCARFIRFTLYTLFLLM